MAAGPAGKEERGAWGTADHPQLMLELRFETGDGLALPYYGIAAIRLSGGMLALFLEHLTVTVRGRHLGELHRELVLHRAAWLQERHASEFVAADAETYIERIELGPPGLTGLANRDVPRG